MIKSAIEENIATKYLQLVTISIGILKSNMTTIYYNMKEDNKGKVVGRTKEEEKEKRKIVKE